MTEKVIHIGDKDVAFRSSAAVPRVYRVKFGRDIFRDLGRLEKSLQENTDADHSTMPLEDLEVFENVAYVMALQADPSVPASIDEWLDQFEFFSIYQILPEILELWDSNLFTAEKSKKNKQAAGK